MKEEPSSAELADRVAATRTRLAATEAELAELCVRYAEVRAAEDESSRAGTAPASDSVSESRRPKPGSFASDELSLVLRRSTWDTSRLLARTRRVRASLPEVAAAARAGVVDAEQVRLIDQTARLAQEAHTLTELDEQVVEAARVRTPQQLRSWLQQFLVRHEPDAAEHRREVSLTDRRVSIAQSVVGIGYVTGEVSAEDAAAIDSRLNQLAWSLGRTDQRTEQQRRSDLFAGLLLGTTIVAAIGSSSGDEVLEVESVDPDTGELIGTTMISIDADGDPITGETKQRPPSWVVNESRRPMRIGVVVPLSSLLGVSETPGELADRSATVPAVVVRELASQPGTLFTRLLTDDGGRLLSTTELGRYASARLAEAIRLRSGSCVYPSCRVTSDRCDLDHHDPVPRGPTAATNLDPLCRRHHRGKTFAGLAAHRDQNTVTWTLPTDHSYRCVDDPLPVP